MLPAVIRALGLAHFGHRERHTDRAEEYRARREAIAAATERLGQLTAERQLSEDVARPLLAEQRDRLERFDSEALCNTCSPGGGSATGATTGWPSSAWNSPAATGPCSLVIHHNS